MKDFFKYLIIMIVVSGGLTACDDFLTQTDPNNLNTDVFWENLEDTKAGLTSAYATLRKSGVINMMQETRRSDMGWPGYGHPTPEKIERTLWYYHTYTNSNAELEDKWADNYEGVFRANQVIAALNGKVERTDENAEEWDLQMGQAKFLRALYHFYLYTSFNKGSIIIRDFVPASIDEIHLPLSPANEVFDFIKTDLEEAYSLLPASYEETSDLGRATKGAAATILGIAHVYNNNDYASAMPYFDDVINNAEYGYQLETDLDLMFTTAGEFNSESILEIAFSNTERTDITSPYNDDVMSNRLNDQTTGTDAAYVPAWLAYAYKTEPMDSLNDINYALSIDPADTTAAGEPNTVFRNVSRRASAMVTLVEDQHTLYYLTDNVSTNMKSSGNNGWGFSFYKKYSNHDIVADENDMPKGKQYSGKNVVINRLSEVYLLQAECIMKTGGDIQEALDLINAIRDRWGLVQLGTSTNPARTYDGYDYISDPDSLMNRIMYIEKPLELSAEGQAIRWNDLRRWGITKERLTQLANQTYYKVDYTCFSMATGKTKTRWNQSIAITPGTDNNAFVIDYEYDIPAANFNAERHNYLPIPLTEIMNNPNIN